MSIDKVFMRGAVVGALTTGCAFVTLNAMPIFAAEVVDRSKTELVKNYYDAEVQVVVSPHGLRKSIEKGEFKGILVDLRSAEEYAEEHIVGAVNIPAYKDRETSAYGDVDRIVNAFRALPTDKEIVVYCYSKPCMTGKKVGKMLADRDIFVKHLGVGWNEWRYHWEDWNHVHEWKKTRVEDYIAQGTEPGVFKAAASAGKSCTDGKLGC